MGDDALWAIFLRMLGGALQRSFPHANILFRHADVPSLTSRECDCFLEDIPLPDFVVLGGGSILGTTLEYFPRLPPNLAVQRHSLGRLTLPTFVFGAGIDDYSLTLSSQSIHGLLRGSSAPIATCPLLDGQSAVALSEHLQMLRGATGFLRDEFTRAQMSCFVRKPRLPHAYDPGLLAGLFLQRSTGAFLSLLPDYSFVAINVGESARMLGAADPDCLHDFFFELATAVAKDHPVVLFSVYPGDARLCQRVGHRLRKLKTLHPVETLAHPLDHSEVLALMDRAFLVVAYKLHAAVLAAAARAPFVTLAYRAKLIGFAHSVGMGEFVFAFDNPFSPQDVLQSLHRLSARREELALLLGQHIAAAVSMIEPTVADYVLEIPALKHRKSSDVFNLRVTAGYFTSMAWVPQDHTCFGFLTIHPHGI